MNNWYYLSCYYLSCRTDKTKDEIVVDLAFQNKVLLLSGIVLGSLSVGILGFAVIRYAFSPPPFLMFHTYETWIAFAFHYE